MKDNDGASLVGAILDRLILFLQGVLCGALLVTLVNGVVEVNHKSVNQPLTDEKKCK